MSELKKHYLYLYSTLKFYTRFEGNSNDETAGGHNGTDTSISYSPAYGKYEQGALFDGLASKIVFTDHADFKPTGSFSFGVWINTTVSGFRLIFQSWSGNTNYAGILIDLSGGGGAIRFISGKNSGTVANTDYKALNGNQNVCTGVWRLIVCTWDGATMFIYVDGQLDNSTAWANAPAYAATNYVRIGSELDTGADDSDFYSGYMDGAFLFNGLALDQQDILSLYNNNYSPKTLRPAIWKPGIAR